MPILINTLESLSSDTQKLMRLAQQVSLKAYNRYSNFNVGAAILCESGNINLGTFMENVSLGLTICAETAAVTSANSAGEKKILEVAIVGGTPESEQITSPCGRCRQVLLEYASIGKNDFPIYCANYNLSKIQLATICELVPIPFCPDQLLSS